MCSKDLPLLHLTFTIQKYGLVAIFLTKRCNTGIQKMQYQASWTTYICNQVVEPLAQKKM
jgi:hypothetical protein